MAWIWDNLGLLLLGGSPVEPSTLLSYDVEDGATITYSWLSNIRDMWSGKETRASLIRTPRQKFEFSSLLTDEQYRLAIGALEADAADAPLFALALAHEDLTIASATSLTITVPSLTLCDWAVDGQRVVVVSTDGERIDTTIDGAPAGSVITLADDVSTVAEPGARIMPVVQTYLEADQDLSRRRINIGSWRLVATAAENGYGATTAWGVGATVATHDGIPVWDRGNVLEDADQALVSDVSLIDTGLGVSAIGKRTLPFWKRGFAIESSDAAEWQWFKAFLMAVRGRAIAFLMPTGRPDAIAESDASTGVLTVSGVDYAGNWAASLAQRRIKLVFADGSTAYRTIISSVDNGDGTQDLTLASSIAGTISRIEFLETVRLDSDDVTVRFQSGAFACSLSAKVLQLPTEVAPSDYATREASIQTGKPRELYTFELDGVTTRYTSSKEDEVFGANTYTATPGLSRGNVTEAPLGDSRDVTVTLPVTHPIAAELLGNGIPPRAATLTIVRFHDPTDTAYRVWLGGIAEISTDDQYARLRVPSLLELAFDVKLPVFKAERTCQHALYGPGCQATRGGFNTPVLFISADRLQITLGIGDPDGFLDGGEIVRVDDVSKRTILTQVGGVLRIDVPFRTLDVGDTVNIVPGCDGQPITCRDKFDNIVNFGGHPDLPEVNPTAATRPKGRSWLWNLIKTIG